MVWDSLANSYIPFERKNWQNIKKSQNILKNCIFFSRKIQVNCVFSKYLSRRKCVKIRSEFALTRSLFVLISFSLTSHGNHLNSLKKVSAIDLFRKKVVVREVRGAAEDHTENGKVWGRKTFQISYPILNPWNGVT